jgi:hypothetical protein
MSSLEPQLPPETAAPSHGLSTLRSGEHVRGVNGEIYKVGGRPVIRPLLTYRVEGASNGAPVSCSSRTLVLEAGSARLPSRGLASLAGAIELRAAENRPRLASTPSYELVLSGISNLKLGDPCLDDQGRFINAQNQRLEHFTYFGRRSADPGFELVVIDPGPGQRAWFGKMGGKRFLGLSSDAKIEEPTPEDRARLIVHSDFDVELRVLGLAGQYRRWLRALGAIERPVRTRWFVDPPTQTLYGLAGSELVGVVHGNRPIVRGRA